jgi:hypothetical protein
MTEKDLVKKLNLLKEIKPEQDWVVLTKRQFIREVRNPSLAEQILEVFRIFPNLSFQYKPALVSLVCLGLLTGTFGLSQVALPGDPFYPIKKMTEKAGNFFVSKDNLPKVNLELANKRLDELTQVAKNNQVRNLAPAINEFQASISQVAKDLNDSPKLTKELVKGTEKLKENREKVVAMGVAVGETEELNQVLSQLVERELKDLESRSLTDAQAKLLQTAKEDYQAGNVSQALEKIILLSYPSN